VKKGKVKEGMTNARCGGDPEKTYWLGPPDEINIL